MKWYVIVSTCLVTIGLSAQAADSHSGGKSSDARYKSLFSKYQTLADKLKELSLDANQDVQVDNGTVSLKLSKTNADKLSEKVLQLKDYRAQLIDKCGESDPGALHFGELLDECLQKDLYEGVTGASESKFTMNSSSMEACRTKITEYFDAKKKRVSTLADADQKAQKWLNEIYDIISASKSSGADKTRADEISKKAQEAIDGITNVNKANICNFEGSTVSTANDGKEDEEPTEEEETEPSKETPEQKAKREAEEKAAADKKKADEAAAAAAKGGPVAQPTLAGGPGVPAGNGITGLDPALGGQDPSDLLKALLPALSAANQVQPPIVAPPGAPAPAAESAQPAQAAQQQPPPQSPPPPQNQPQPEPEQSPQDPNAGMQQGMPQQFPPFQRDDQNKPIILPPQPTPQSTPVAAAMTEAQRAEAIDKASKTAAADAVARLTGQMGPNGQMMNGMMPGMNGMQPVQPPPGRAPGWDPYYGYATGQGGGNMTKLNSLGGRGRVFGRGQSLLGGSVVGGSSVGTTGGVIRGKISTLNSARAAAKSAVRAVKRR